jgi:hypothetical protein
MYDRRITTIEVLHTFALTCAEIRQSATSEETTKCNNESAHLCERILENRCHGAITLFEHLHGQELQVSFIVVGTHAPPSSGVNVLDDSDSDVELRPKPFFKPRIKRRFDESEATPATDVDDDGQQVVLFTIDGSLNPHSAEDGNPNLSKIRFTLSASSSTDRKPCLTPGCFCGSVYVIKLESPMDHNSVHYQTMK